MLKDSILGYATLSIDRENTIISIAYTMINPKDGTRVVSGITHRDVAGSVRPNFDEKMAMLRMQNVFEYTINRIVHQDGHATIHMMHNRYIMKFGDFYNQYLYSGAKIEAVVTP